MQHFVLLQGWFAGGTAFHDVQIDVQIRAVQISYLKYKSSAEAPAGLVGVLQHNDQAVCAVALCKFGWVYVLQHNSFLCGQHVLKHGG